MIEFFKKLEQIEASLNTGTGFEMPQILSTHPAIGERIIELKKSIESIDDKNYSISVFNYQAFKQSIDKQLTSAN